jgi:tetratricopeptide (TPR) repeat protein
VRPRGGVLVNDYGYRPREARSRHDAFQHFGPSLANGLNLEELERFAATQDGWAVAAPATDSSQVASRWIGRADERLAAGIFALVFDGARRDRALELLRSADDAADAKRNEEARWLYWRAREAAPRSWHVLERWARFCLARQKDAEGAAGLAQAGLSLHPRHPGLWNVLGDAEYERGRTDEAETAFRRALEVSPRDVRGRLNLSYVLQDRGDHAGALALLAEALAIDASGDWRDALLDRQRQVMIAQTLDARDALLQQVNRFRNLEAPAPPGAGGMPVTPVTPPQ